MSMAKKNDNLEEQNKPILIYVDEFEIRKSMAKLDEIIIPVLNGIKLEFNTLQTRPFLCAYLKDILLIDMLSIKIQTMAQIERKTPSLFLKDETTEKSHEMLEWILLTLKTLESKLGTYCFYDLLKYPSVDEFGNIVITEEAAQTLREANSIYVTTPKARELYEAHKAATLALDRFYQITKGEITSNIVDVASFFTIDEDDHVIQTVRDYESSSYVTGRI